MQSPNEIEKMVLKELSEKIDVLKEERNLALRERNSIALNVSVGWILICAFLLWGVAHFQSEKNKLQDKLEITTTVKNQYKDNWKACLEELPPKYPKIYEVTDEGK